jgi:hypothetical protein
MGLLQDCIYLQRSSNIRVFAYWLEGRKLNELGTFQKLASVNDFRTRSMNDVLLSIALINFILDQAHTNALIGSHVVA